MWGAEKRAKSAIKKEEGRIMKEESAKPLGIV